MAALRAAWPRAAGVAVAGAAIPVRRTKAGVLTVACRSAAWAQELAGHVDTLRARLAELAPEASVTGLRFVVGDHVMPDAPPPPPPPPPPAGPVARAAAARIVGPVGDERLRGLLERGAAAALQREGGQAGGKTLQNAE